MKERFLHSQRLQVCAFPVNLVSINKGNQKYFVKHGFIPDQLTYSNSESTPPFLQGETETQEIKGDMSKVM